MGGCSVLDLADGDQERGDPVKNVARNVEPLAADRQLHHVRFFEPQQQRAKGLRRGAGSRRQVRHRLRMWPRFGLVWVLCVALSLGIRISRAVTAATAATAAAVLGRLRGSRKVLHKSGDGICSVSRAIENCGHWPAAHQIVQSRLQAWPPPCRRRRQEQCRRRGRHRLQIRSARPGHCARARAGARTRAQVGR
jgi:hypothetical protein